MNTKDIKLKNIAHPEPNGLNEIMYCNPESIEIIEIEIINNSKGGILDG